jgi:two-component system, OmpR family, aerobic respiration control sensor histidine kinase ArcB
MNDKSKKKPIVLVVEDNEIAQRLAQVLLYDLGCDVVVAYDGATAIESFKKNEFSFILMDIGLPDSDGYKITKEIRCIENGQMRTPIIGLSAHSSGDVLERAIKAGMDEYVVKPITDDLCNSLSVRYGVQYTNVS